MPDLTLSVVLDAADPEAMAPHLARFFADGDGGARVESTRLQPPICYWAVYVHRDQRVTFKSFFKRVDYDAYAAALTEYYPDRVDQPRHPAGGFVLLPELNGLLWRFPFDPAMPSLSRCLDGAWVAEAIRRPRADLTPRLRAYNPEIGASVTYRDERSGRATVFGKCSPAETAGLEYLVMDELWRSDARRRGDLLVSQPLAYRADMGILLQRRVRGRAPAGERNSRAFLDLALAAGRSLAALHATPIGFGPERGADDVLARIEGGLEELALTAPPLYDTLRRLIGQIRARTARGDAGEPVASHGDFKYDQFLCYRHRYVLIDFELFCRAERWLDLAHFCAYLPPSSPDDWREAAAGELVRARFLESYRTASGRRVDWERLGLYEAALLALRGLSHVWAHEPDWQVRAGALLDLGFERLVSPEPRETRRSNAAV